MAGLWGASSQGTESCGRAETSTTELSCSVEQSFSSRARVMEQQVAQAGEVYNRVSYYRMDTSMTKSPTEGWADGQSCRKWYSMVVLV